MKTIRAYYGEKIAMYFAWLEYYVIWLIFPAILGLVVYILGLHYDDIQDTEPAMTISEIAILTFSLLLAIGSSLLDQMWLRRQNELSWMWGTVNLLEVEQQRTSFKGKYGKDPVDGRKKKISENKGYERFKRAVSYLISFLFVTLVFATVVGLFMLRANGILSTKLCSYINGLQIKVMNYLYRIVAVKLTFWENYEYESKYNDSLTLKLYLFQFINSYVSLFYIAFFKSSFEGCLDGDCLGELTTQLTSIFLINVAMNGAELGTPLLKNWLKKNSEKKALEKMIQSGEVVRTELTPIEEQSKLADYDTPLDDYMELIINYGYVIMFSCAFPIVPMIALLINIFEIRVDAFKLTHLCKRPYPDPANSIGEWEIIIRTISFLGALTNTGIIIFTTDVFDLEDASVKWMYFLLIEHVLLMFKFFIDRQIPDCPSKVKDGITWSERITNERLFGRASDEDKQKELRQLFFKPIQGVKEIPYNDDNIRGDNY